MSTLVRACDCNWLLRVRFIKKIKDWIPIACVAGTRKVERGKLGAREKRIASRAPDFDFPSPFLFLVPATQARTLKSEGIWKWILRFFTRQINPRFSRIIPGPAHTFQASLDLTTGYQISGVVLLPLPRVMKL